MEYEISLLKERSINDNSVENRLVLSRARAEYIKLYKVQEAILRQKTRIKWLEEGDANTASFFFMKLEEKGLPSKIMDEQHQLIEGKEAISEAAAEYFQKIFFSNHQRQDLKITEQLQMKVKWQDNNMLIASPTIQEARDDAIYPIDSDSAPGLDGYRGCFFQSAWNVFQNDVHNAIVAFFGGAELTKFYTHTCLVMIPKVESPQNFIDLRSIRLCNVSSKIISKILNTRLSLILPNLISNNQFDFIKGRSMSENILLAQKIIKVTG